MELSSRLRRALVINVGVALKKQANGVAIINDPKVARATNKTIPNTANAPIADLMSLRCPILADFLLFGSPGDLSNKRVMPTPNNNDSARINI